MRLRIYAVMEAGKGYVRKVHRDERGAISVLVLLMFWCLIAILGLVMDTTEEAYRREQIQTAADTAAHAASTWVARTGNAITAQNMVICQDASAESIWRGVPPTDQAINARLTGEITAANQMKQQQTLQDLQQRLQTQLTQIGTDYQLTMDAWNNLSTGNGANFATPTEQMNFANSLRQAKSAMGWTLNTYINGATPPILDPLAPVRPGPPGPNGEGLAQVIAAWKPLSNENAILDYIINFINTQEMPVKTAFEARTAYAVGQPVSAQMATHEAEVFANEMEMLSGVAVTVEAQRAQIADFYQTDITLATLKNSPGNAGPAAVTAPYMAASDVTAVTGHVDLIRTAYPMETAKAGLNPVVTIDGISPHTDANRIWHPDLVAVTPAGLRGQYPTLKPAYTVSADFPDGWGHIRTMPLERYFQQRVNSDKQELDQTFMVPLDNLRQQTLAAAIRQMLGIPNGNVNIASLPGTIPDDQAEPNPPLPPLPPGTPPPPTPPERFDPIFVLPRLTAPANATAAYRTQVDLYNTNGAKITADVRTLRTLMTNFTFFFQRFITPFASETWQTNVNSAAAGVLDTLGQNKQFVVLSTYGLRPIPDWAKPGMFDSAASSIENQLVTIALTGVSQAIMQDLRSSNPGGFGGGILDASYLQTVLTGAYTAEAAQVADAIVRPVAHQIAQEIAAEWVNRPWPYEITPPDMPVPPVRGVMPDERKLQFSVLAAARQTDANAPKLLLTKIFGTDSGKIVAYAQAESFNWMEFNAEDGAQVYDQVISVPELVYRVRTSRFSGFVGSPRGWRVGSLAGWSWRARLSYSDALYEALEVNQDLNAYLNDAGISSPSRGALDEINLH
ncbi:MAG TPA: pilus assembly protein TadG-related protein [Phycisphaerae bacterium]